MTVSASGRTASPASVTETLAQPPDDSAHPSQPSGIHDIWTCEGMLTSGHMPEASHARTLADLLALPEYTGRAPFDGRSR